MTTAPTMCLVPNREAVGTIFTSLVWRGLGANHQLLDRIGGRYHWAVSVSICFISSITSRWIMYAWTRGNVVITGLCVLAGWIVIMDLECFKCLYTQQHFCIRSHKIQLSWLKIRVFMLFFYFFQTTYLILAWIWYIIM